jgi:hypothetical protein
MVAVDFEAGEQTAAASLGTVEGIACSTVAVP